MVLLEEKPRESLLVRVARSPMKSPRRSCGGCAGAGGGLMESQTRSCRQTFADRVKATPGYRGRSGSIGIARRSPTQAARRPRGDARGLSPSLTLLHPAVGGVQVGGSSANCGGGLRGRRNKTPQRPPPAPSPREREPPRNPAAGQGLTWSRSLSWFVEGLQKDLSELFLAPLAETHAPRGIHGLAMAPAAEFPQTPAPSPRRRTTGTPSRAPCRDVPVTSRKSAKSHRSRTRGREQLLQELLRHKANWKSIAAKSRGRRARKARKMERRFRTLLWWNRLRRKFHRPGPRSFCLAPRNFSVLAVVKPFAEEGPVSDAVAA